MGAVTDPQSATAGDSRYVWTPALRRQTVRLTAFLAVCLLTLVVLGAAAVSESHGTTATFAAALALFILVFMVKVVHRTMRVRSQTKHLPPGTPTMTRGPIDLRWVIMAVEEGRVLTEEERAVAGPVARRFLRRPWNNAWLSALCLIAVVLRVVHGIAVAAGQPLWRAYGVLFLVTVVTGSLYSDMTIARLRRWMTANGIPTRR